MGEVTINGSNNITTNGDVGGNIVIGDIYLLLSKFDLFTTLKSCTMNNDDKEQLLINMTETQKKLAEAVEKFSQAELVRAEAAKNNSEANLNYSKVMLEDREMINKLIDKLK